MASDLHVDLYRHWPFLHRVRTVEPELSSSAVHSSRCPGRVANDAVLLLLWDSASRPRSLQSSPETRIHLRCGAGYFVSADRTGDMEAGAVFLARLDHGRVPLGARVAFRSNVGDLVLPPGTPGNGCCPRLEQFHVDAYGMEEESRVPSLAAQLDDTYSYE